MSRLWILGAPRPEMEAIEALLRECGETVFHAADVRGSRVRASASYQAESIITRHGTHPCTSGVTSVYLVECELLTPDVFSDPGEDICHPELAGRAVHRIDHHRPGDPGYGRAPEDFLAASSLGQVIAELARLGRLPDWETLSMGEYDDTPRGELCLIGGHPDQPHFPLQWAVVAACRGETGGDWGADCGTYFMVPPDLVLVAAADHCLAHAYAGHCPGVDPDALMAWRVQSRAKFQARDVSDVLADVARAREALYRAPGVALRRVCIACAPGLTREKILTSSAPDCGHDYRGFPVCEVSRDHEAFEIVEARDMREAYIAELPEASAREGVCFISRGLPDPSGRAKVVCQSGSPEQIRAFIDHWAPRNGLIDIYGDPARGFAGGYLHGVEGGES